MSILTVISPIINSGVSHSYIPSLMHSSMHPLILQMFIWCHYVQTVLSVGTQSVAYPPGPAPYSVHSVFSFLPVF